MEIYFCLGDFCYNILPNIFLSVVFPGKKKKLLFTHRDVEIMN